MFGYTFRTICVPFMSDENNQTFPAEEKENDECESTRNDNEALNRKQARRKIDK
jgi:hypothetical protein